MFRFVLLWFCSVLTQFPVWVWFCLSIFPLLSLSSIFRLLNSITQDIFHSVPPVCGSRSGESCGVVEDSEPSAADDYDVFLSFRGPDTRQGFTDVLYDTMKRAGIRVFRDDDEISIGQPLRKILHAIETSQICVPIFSQTFAKSSWCLREVARMIELKKVVMPIFYDVTPDDVKLKTKTYYKDLKMHKKNYGKEQVEMWEDALREVSRIKGKEVLNTRYTEFCKKLVDEGLSKLKPRKRSSDESLIGIDPQIKSVINSMDMGSPDVLYIAIHGMGGIGKTTLAKALFENLSTDFDSSYFLRDVRESSLRCKDLQDLQNQLQVGLDPEFAKGCNSLRSIEERFQNEKVLIVLDDVNKLEQVEKLAGHSSWFGSGSRIIITTRDVDVLTRYAKLDRSKVRLFEMRTLCPDQAFELFCRYAFREEKVPTIELEDISREIALKTGGLPLALKVIGSLLCNVRDEAVWRDVKSRLKTKPFEEVMDTLRISYEALKDDQKQIFLDIACLPVTIEKDRGIHIWEASKLYPHFNLAVLSSMSLVKIHGNIIWMHDLLKDLGKDIALKNGTRIWKTEQLLEVLHSKEVNDHTYWKFLHSKEGKEKIEVLYIDKPLEAFLTHEDFANFPKLRFLHLVGSNIEGDFRYLLPNLTWLSWRRCPPILKITNLYFKNLVVLDLSFSFISESWGGWSLIENLNHLKELDLSNCHNLTTTPDFSKTNRLERLDLHHCSELHEIHGSIGNLLMLKYLDLLECSSLEGLPDEIGCLVNLKTLQVSHTRWGNEIKRYFSLPSSIGDLESLIVLKLEHLGIIDIPYSIGRLANLHVLSLQGCSMMKDLPTSFGNLDSLGELNLSLNTKLNEMPNSIGGLVNLQILNLHGCLLLKILPESFGLLQELKELRLSCCHLRKLPVSIGFLSKLEVFEYDSHGVLEELPNEIGSLSRLRRLILIGSSISTLPSSIRQLHFLEELDLDDNHELQELPDLPLSLCILKVSSKSLRKISELSTLVNLTEFHFFDMDDYRCPSQVSTSSKLEGIEKLIKLKSLRLSVANVTALQYDMCSLPLLEALLIDFQPHLEAYFYVRPYAPASSLELLDNSEDNLWLKLPDLSRLKNLLSLSLKNWYIKDGVERGLGIWNLGNVISVSILNCGIEIIEQTCQLKNLMSLAICSCGSLKTLPNLSEMKLLFLLVVSSCKELVEIPGLRNLESLTSLNITRCASLEQLENLSKLISLSNLWLQNCPELSTIEGTEKIMLLDLHIDECGSLQNVSELKKRSKRGSIDGLKFQNFL